MIIRRLHIDNFGCFHDFDLELHEGINHLVWHNEQGKSTLLEFIRRIFWGFPDKRSKLNPYPALNGSGLYGGFLEVTTSDGTLLRLERKGLKSPLKIIHIDGTAESVSDVGSFTGISELFYRNVCAVTLDELTAFAALDDPEIRNRLYGNALSGGGVSLSSVQSALSSEAEQIYKKRGTLHLLKRLSAEFAASEKSLAEASEAMPAYEKAVLNAEKFEKESDLLKEKISALQQQIDLAEKALTSESLRRKLAEDEALFAGKLPPAPMPEPMPSFSESAPPMPPEPALPELPPRPEEPRFPALEGKCDLTRGAAVTEDDVEKLDRLLFEKQECKRKPLRFLTLAGAALLLLPVAALMVKLSSAAAAVLLCMGLSLLTFSLLKFNGAKKTLAGLDKKLKDLFFRFALNPALEDGDLLSTLEEMAAAQGKRLAYEKELKLYEEAKSGIGQLNLEYRVARQKWEAEFRSFEERRKEYDRKRLAHEESCRQLAALHARYEAEKLALIKRKKELEELYPPSPDSLLPEEELTGRKEELKSLKEALEHNMNASGAERREAALLLRGVDSAALLNIREQLRGRMRSGAERYLVLAAARAILDRAVERSERERQPELLKKAALFLSEITGNRYTRVWKSATDNLLKISAPDAPEGKNASQLSRGTREQLFLALRMALIDSLPGDMEHLPVAFDDIFVNFDNTRRSAAWRCIEEFARNRQVIVFECK